MKKIIILGVIVVILVIGFFMRDSFGGSQKISKLDTIDTVGSFYGDWLKAVKDPNVVPNLASLSKSPYLSKALRTRIMEALKIKNPDVDPVLCQSVIPEAISTRNVFMSDDKAEVLVMSRDNKVTNQAIVELNKLNGIWYMNDIKCSLGEFAPEKEFTFEQKGFLLKDSIPAPYNSKNWHLVYEEEGQKGNVIPLFFDSKSKCINTDKTEAVCKPDQLKETTEVFIQGQMTERGITVNRLELIKK
ncbi:MAG: hypothetical protein ACYC1K_00495 [Minisyncoccota bacterium]